MKKYISIELNLISLYFKILPTEDKQVILSVIGFLLYLHRETPNK